MVNFVYRESKWEQTVNSTIDKNTGLFVIYLASIQLYYFFYIIILFLFYVFVLLLLQ